MVLLYLSSPEKVIAHLILHIKHYQQFKDAKVDLKIDSSSYLICVYLICMCKLNDALIFEHLLLW